MLKVPAGGYYNVGTWSLIELDAAIISACLPTLRPLFQSSVPKLRSLATPVKEILTSWSPKSKDGKESLSSRDGYRMNGWEQQGSRDPKGFYMSRVTAGSDTSVQIQGILRSTDIESQSQGIWSSPSLQGDRPDARGGNDIEAQRS